jgi:hypothetical protein
VTGGTVDHVQIHLSRNAKRLDGTLCETESSSRSRSLLFLALGLAASANRQVPLWIPENVVRLAEPATRPGAAGQPIDPNDTPGLPERTHRRPRHGRRAR